MTTKQLFSKYWNQASMKVRLDLLGSIHTSASTEALAHITWTNLPGDVAKQLVENNKKEEKIVELRTQLLEVQKKIQSYSPDVMSVPNDLYVQEFDLVEELRFFTDDD